MRLSRWLILAALLAIVVFVLQTYIKRQQALAHEAPAALGSNWKSSHRRVTRKAHAQARTLVYAVFFVILAGASLIMCLAVSIALSSHFLNNLGAPKLARDTKNR